MKSPETFTVPVASATKAAKNLVLLTLDVGGTPVAGTHQRAGQYTFLKRGNASDEKARPFAVACAPQADRLEILVREQESLQPWLDLQGTGHVHVATVGGPGYPLADLRGRDLLFLAMGSAIAPIRAALSVVAADRGSFGTVQLIYGERDEESLCFNEALAAFEQADVSVTKVLSAPKSDWNGPRGYVQDHLPVTLSETLAVILCGSPAMEKACMATLEETGVAKAQLYRNF